MICLWIRHKHDQQSGPPLKNAFVQIRAKVWYDSETKIIATAHTDESGCVSESFEVTSAASAITLIVDTPDGGSIYSGEYYVTSTKQDFQDLSVDIDNLPEKYFPRLYSCSTCRDASDAHLCTLGWDYEKCCGYDFDTDQCREVQSRPFSFGNVCEECEAVDINENEQKGPGFKENNSPVDCSIATHYYPDASMHTPKNERGSLSPLTNHACTYPDQNTTMYENVYRFGTSCCAYDYSTEQCGLWENDYSHGYQYYINKAKGMFLYPCSFGPSRNIGAIAGGIIGGLICAFAVAYIAFKRRKTRLDSSEEVQSNHEVKESKKPKETKKDNLACNHGGNKAFNYENITPVPLPSAPPKEEYDIAIASPVILRGNNNGDNQVVYEAHIISDDI
ncbi:predicted protein [Chaetoceros tenuissimus]|uniref:Uncharacterized protein n=1 Tax=Chaetoceros tenuissimus TaxID=426638 RepID=A0AAD3CEI9_9STRA|nr:predicted protein [Chaetoceros tenuissimus]